MKKAVVIGGSGFLGSHVADELAARDYCVTIFDAKASPWLGENQKLILGNIKSKRDWGHAEDYVEAMWKIMQFKKPEDFVICSGKQHSIKGFINLVAKDLNMKIKWVGKGMNEKAFDHKNNCIIECNKKYFRPSEVDTLIGSYSKAKRILKWSPKHNIRSLIKDMINYELKNI